MATQTILLSYSEGAVPKEGCFFVHRKQDMTKQVFNYSYPHHFGQKNSLFFVARSGAGIKKEYLPIHRRRDMSTQTILLSYSEGAVPKEGCFFIDLRR